MFYKSLLSYLQASLTSHLCQKSTLFLIPLLTFLIFTSLGFTAEVKPESKSDVSDVEEILVIDDKEYVIPAPWSGNRLEDPQLTFSSFSQIPLKYARNNTKLYILKKAQPHLVEMLEQAERDGTLIQVESAYRSVSYQKTIFKRMLSEGRTFEDIVRYVAPPGYSEHMLGTAVDFYPSNWRFAKTPQHIWLQEHANEFGFFNTYSEFNQHKMPWEAWHWNYNGLPQ